MARWETFSFTVVVISAKLFGGMDGAFMKSFGCFRVHRPCGHFREPFAFYWPFFGEGLRWIAYSGFSSLRYCCTLPAFLKWLDGVAFYVIFLVLFRSGSRAFHRPGLLLLGRRFISSEGAESVAARVFDNMWFRKPHVLNAEKDPEDSANKAKSEESVNVNADAVPKDANAPDSTGDMEEDDDDFITNEVKRRLKELRRNTFMVLIPEESYPEEDSSSSECRESETEEGYPWSSFNAFYEKFGERMLFFDKVIAQKFHEAVSQVPLNPSPRSASKKLASTLRNLSFKRREELQDDGEQLQQPQEPQDDPYQDLENAYVAQVCLAWEALQCQYLHLSDIISSEPENLTCYGYAAQQFQQFQVLLQRFIENEPFEQGNRVENFAKTKTLLPKLLQVPSFQGLRRKESEKEDSDMPVPATEFWQVMQSAILTFHIFLKLDKKKQSNVLQLFGTNQVASPLQLLQSSLDKKEVKLKDMRRKKKGWKKKSWPPNLDEVELLFGLIDIKIVSRVLRMETEVIGHSVLAEHKKLLSITSFQLVWGVEVSSFRRWIWSFLCQSKIADKNTRIKLTTFFSRTACHKIL
ncbi:hypothetical protein H6P81_009237 [Aristolochia fimbriata]|uniref:Uncharacterized protein n=1 Tax=Aristolochia fimbriata TaxID=158543 RepID=A0AAV7EKA3_ARIFI|nr:hypothetical protein H6P81_009237 [Aristolochia fimbriata]